MIAPWIMLSISVVLALVTLVLVLVVLIAGSRSLEGKLKTKGYAVPILIAGVALAICALNLALDIFSNMHNGVAKLSGWELLVSSLLKTAKAIGVDENMDKFDRDLRGMMKALQESRPYLQSIVGIYAGILYVVAPVAGGIGLLEILAGVFPQMRLFFLRHTTKDKYYFSQLHDGSLELVRNICQVKMKNRHRPVLIFTGVDVDKSDLEAARRLDEAKAMGAICLRSDLRSTPKWGFGQRKFFLVEEDEVKVLQQMSGLATEKNYKSLKNAEVFFFVTSDAYVPIERNIRVWLHQKGVEFSSFTPVRTNTKLIENLLVNVPLYEPLLCKEEKEDGSKDLTVAILGAGGIGREMLLNTYWMGQMLDCNLTINVFSQEEENAFWSKLDYVNPEIRLTTQKDHPILNINRKCEKAQPYCTIRYHQCKLGAGCLGIEESYFQNTDYVFIALGSDQDNITMAKTLCRCVGEDHVRRQNGNKTVIAYVVYDPDLAEAANKNKGFCYAVPDRTDVYMLAMGSLPETYSLETVLGVEAAAAQKIADNYELLLDSVNRKRAYQMRNGKFVPILNKKGEKIGERWEWNAGTEDDAQYKYWASCARSMHKSYKLYSAGLLQTSLFDCASEEEFRQKRSQEAQKGAAVIQGKSQGGCDEARARLMHRLSWLEHRRWNAFTRVLGYRYTDAYHKYQQVTGNHKHMALKLHPCLVECDQQGIRCGLDENGHAVTMAPSYLAEADRDLLDDLTYDLCQNCGMGYDFKLYDYPQFDFD